MKHLITLLVFALAIPLKGQNQTGVSRIDLMPDMPSPYVMRDWKKVAWKYDTLLFSRGTSGNHTPLLRIGSSGVNYPEIAPIYLDSYVGSSSHGQQREGINIIPAIVGASLVGIDKTTQYSIDWVSKVKDYYNLKNGEYVYLNSPSSSSGYDWWYETMPNIFFYQLYDLYPQARDADFKSQFFTVADRWLEAVAVMGGGATPWSVPKMNYRAWNLKEMKPGVAGVNEPEAAGAISWILYQAYNETGNEKYLIGAQWALDFLNALENNPSYELQLSYGVITAAKMNAEFHANYNLDKMLNWCFDRGNLRGWGSIIGTWTGYDVSGLIGEANDQGNDYAFLMNGFQQGAALAPLVKYDKRYSKAIAKWILNMANASRLFYSAYLPESRQSDFQWSNQNDPNSVIAYEAIKENWQGNGIYARGDSKDAGWAATNLGIYGSSHVGYLAAIVEKTNVEGILLINTDVTDFFTERPFQTNLIFNPHNEVKTIQLSVGADSKDIYNAITETFPVKGVSGSVSVDIQAGEVMLISCIPAGSEISVKESRLMVGSDILDYHYTYDFNPRLKIRALVSASDSVEVAQPARIYATLNANWEASYEWYLNDQLQSETGDVFEWTPSATGPVDVKLRVTSQGQTAQDSIHLKVVELIPQSPVIDTLYAEKRWMRPGSEFWVNAQVHDPRNLDIDLDWSVENAEVIEETNQAIKVKAGASGLITISLIASNYALKSSESISLLVTETASDSEPLVYLPLDGFSSDQSGNKFETKLTGGRYVDDSEGTGQHAIQILAASDELLVTNTSTLNFTGQITVSFWARFTDFSEERFVLSHGSWENRWKVSTTTEKKLRWTVKTSAGIKDLDAGITLKANEWYHFAVIYSGSSLQIYLNGELDVFVPHSGTIGTSDLDICIGKRFSGDSRYFLKGIIDEVKIFNKALDPERIRLLPGQRLDVTPLGLNQDEVRIFPNPASAFLTIDGTLSSSVSLVDLVGGKIEEVKVISTRPGRVDLQLPTLPSGIYILHVENSRFKIVIDAK